MRFGRKLEDFLGVSAKSQATGGTDFWRDFPIGPRYNLGMSLTLHLPPELEAQLHEQAKSLGKTPEQIVMATLQSRFLDVSHEVDTEEVAPLPIDKWLSIFDAWVAGLESRNPPVDDSRESIYPDRW